MLFIVTQRAVLPDGVRPCVIATHDERIVGLFETLDAAQLALGDAAVLNAPHDAVVMPGVVDTHVHINEPGRAHWEGFATATRAAAAGGITTLVEMPLNAIPPTNTVDGLVAKLDAARDQCHVDLGLWGGVVPDNLDQLLPLWDAGVLGFKCFMVHSGVDEFPCVSPDQLREAVARLHGSGAVIQAHAELPGPIDQATDALDLSTLDARRDYKNYLASRPPDAEHLAIKAALDLCRDDPFHLHVVHLSAADALDTLRAARAEGLPVTVETCPHYLLLCAEDIPDGATPFKCAPPIRSRDNNDRLWRALVDGDIDMIATDHSPSPPDLKRLSDGDFFAAWGGVASLQLSLSLVWTAARRHQTPLSLVARWLCEAPARLAGLSHRKGAIRVGLDADLVIWRPDASFSVEPDDLHHKHPLTPYAGHTLYGVVEHTLLRGRVVFSSRDGVDATPRGRWIPRADPAPAPAHDDLDPASETPASLRLHRLNALHDADARELLRGCCGAAAWFEAVTDARPFGAPQEALDAADVAWQACGPTDWLEAFAAHPRIGEKKDADAANASSRSWSRQEQAAAHTAASSTLDQLAFVNAAYEQKFGFIYIVFATGKSAAQMLDIARARLDNDRDTELRNGAAEQHKITRLRLSRLLEGSS